MLSKILRQILSLFIPSSCPVCGSALDLGEGVICPSCEVTAPYTYLWREPYNAMDARLGGLLPVVHSAAFVWFVEGNAWREAIHSFKYQGRWRAAYDLGRRFGAELKESGLYADVDVVIAVPLHLRRRLRRGYNQSEYIARGIARELGVEVDTRSVVRRRYNATQTTKSVVERWENVEGIFSVRHAERLAGKHILLVDDVFTTGATIISLGSEILGSVGGARLSIATLAASRRGLNLE